MPTSSRTSRRRPHRQQSSDRGSCYVVPNNDLQRPSQLPMSSSTQAYRAEAAQWSRQIGGHGPWSGVRAVSIVGRGHLDGPGAEEGKRLILLPRGAIIKIITYSQIKYRSTGNPRFWEVRECQSNLMNPIIIICGMYPGEPLNRSIGQ